MDYKLNLLEELREIKKRDFNAEEIDIQCIVNDIFKQKDATKASVLHQLTSAPVKNSSPNFNIDDLNREHIFHISQIKNLCLNYRLRFLDTQYFKGEFPSEAIRQVDLFQKKHQTMVGQFKIIAPSKLFVLKETDDPILFAHLGNGYYYFLHKWGDDMNISRKLKAWPLKNFKNLATLLFLISTLATALTYPYFLKNNFNVGYLFCLWLFYVKGTFAICLYMGVASGKTFSKYCWQSPFNKI
ncbi:hypothetical protein ACXGQW_03800 [Wenyingzhuangia sp. IMCC45533]